jgi:hypothetical protein
MKQVLLQISGVRSKNSLPVAFQFQRSEFFGAWGSKRGKDPGDPDIDWNRFQPSIGKKEDAVGHFPANPRERAEGFTSICCTHGAK